MGIFRTSSLNNAGQRPSLFLSTSEQRQRGNEAGVFGSITAPGVAGSGGPGLFPAADGNPLGNPNFSCIAGPEILPSIGTSVPVDVGTGYIFQHFLGPTGIGSFVNEATAEFKEFDDILQHYVAFDLYLNEQSITTYTAPIQVVLPLRTVTTSGGVVLHGGATALECLLSTDADKYVEMDSSGPGVLTLQFDPAELEANWDSGRIAKMSLRYVAWRDDDSEPVPGEGFRCEWFDNGASDFIEIGSWLVQNYARYAVKEMKECGETNPMPRSKEVTYWPSFDLNNFTVQDMGGMSAAENRNAFRITALAGDITQTTTYYDSFELVLEMIPEYRSAAAIRYVSNAQYASANMDGSYTKGVQWRYPLASNSQIILSNTEDYYMVVREARPADPSDYYRAKTTGQQTVASMEAFGPPLEIMGIIQHRSADEFEALGVKQIQTFRGAVTDGQFVPGSVQNYLDFRLSVAHYNPLSVETAGAFWASYRAMAGYELMKVYSGKNVVQRVWLEAGVDYAWIRVLAQPTPQANADIEFQIYNSALVLLTTTFSYDPETWRDLLGDNNSNGWNEALIETLDVITPAVSDWYYIVAVSAAGSQQGWLVSGAEPTGMQPYFSYDIAADGFGTGDARIVDFAMTFDCDGTPIPAPTVTVGSNDLLGVSCGVSTAATVEIEWVSDGNWDQYVIQKRTLDYNEGDGFTYQSISKAITALPAGQTHTYVFPAPPWDARTEYYLVGHRASDLLEVRSAASVEIVIPSQGAVLGISQLGVEDGTNVIYAPTANGGTVEIQWENMTVVEPIALHGQDNYAALVPLELRGLSFTVMVMVDYLGFCTTPADESMEGLTTGQRSLDRKVWATLVDLANYGRVWVQFPGGRVEGYIMQLGTLNASTEHGVFAAELRFTKLSGISLGLLGDDE